ncbi:uncharacterized protein LOC120358675 [Solenopsis invicta]|uniref:uncharacterized protein LOC120358675 n=1 Tax=Solenopsis invicta TaxID=13686 RepID=UPI00193D7C9E|nr:uncharacterized protein LOC120358675 [Solenopsis invicta]
MPVDRSPPRNNTSSETTTHDAPGPSTEDRFAMPLASNHDVNGISAHALTNLKIPPFWKDDPALWFAQIEMAFEISRISSDKTKFNYTVLNLDQSVMPFVSDIVRKPPEERKYETL